ncbi:MAG: SDR family oxidoreductase [Planctomycetes bacterium]|nr:SDR family oxidoreductase [Planctomycetota bacterium]
MTTAPAGGRQIDLRGRVALVTGAAGQLGRTMAETLASYGADVAIHYRSGAETAELLAARLAQAGRRSLAVQADLTVAAEVAAMRDRIRATLGDPDIVVLNAVTSSGEGWTSILEGSAEAHEILFRGCTMQAVHCAKAFAPAMRARGSGRIIGISTECAHLLNPNQGAYSAAKRGMDGILRTLARELGPDGITVNQVAPGWTISERSRAAPEDDAGYIRSVPLRRRGTDQDIAAAVAFLASDLAGSITGVWLPVTGGLAMPGI